MPIANYGVLDTNAPNRLASLFNPEDIRARQENAMLREQKLVGEQQQQQLAAEQLRQIPIQREAGIRSQRESVSRQLDSEVANMLGANIPRQVIAKRIAAKAKQSGFQDEEIQSALDPLNKIQDTVEAQKYYLNAANPQEAQKRQMEALYQKPRQEDALAEKRYKLQEKELAWKMGQKPATPLEPPPKAAPGSRVYQEGGEWKSEIIKGSPQWQMYKSKEAPDRALVQNIVPQFEKNVSDIDKLVSSKGFDKIFGLIAGQTPNITKESREAANLRAQVIGAMETSGMQLQRSAGGAVGSMTVQEWPKMQSYMNVIQNSNDPQAVKEALRGAQAVYDRMAEVAKEGYMNEWGSGQFGDPNVVARLSKAKQKTQEPATSYEADKEARYQAWKAQQGR